MNATRRFRGTMRHVRMHWPPYLLLYGGVVGALLLIGGGITQGWPGLVPLGLALWLVSTYFLFTALWTAYQLHDAPHRRPHAALFAMSQVRPTDHIAYVGLGWRGPALELYRYLTEGELVVVDVYNPQLAPGRGLARERTAAPSPPQDPRLRWRDGSIALLPLPNASVTAVFAIQVLSELSEHGDRVKLLREIYRVLPPNGRLLIAERLPTQTNWLALGPLATRLAPKRYWLNLLAEAGFQVQAERDLLGLIHCFRADKPVPGAGRQLRLDLEF
jgi:SAM-dependent methyltransferase